MGLGDRVSLNFHELQTAANARFRRGYDFYSGYDFHGRYDFYSRYDGYDGYDSKR